MLSPLSQRGRGSGAGARVWGRGSRRMHPTDPLGIRGVSEGSPGGLGCRWWVRFLGDPLPPPSFHPHSGELVEGRISGCLLLQRQNQPGRQPWRRSHVCLGTRGYTGRGCADPRRRGLVRPLPLVVQSSLGHLRRVGVPSWAPRAPQKQGSRARCSHVATVFSGSCQRLLGQKRLSWDGRAPR